MTKKHFIALADEIKDSNARFETGAVTAILFREEHINVLADFCQAQNPCFNRERWIGYISGANGPNGGKV